MRIICCFILCFFILTSCKTAKKLPSKPVEVTLPVPETPKIDSAKPVIKVIDKVTKTDPFLLSLLNSRPEIFNDFITNKDSLRVQVIYTRIDRQADNTPVFQPYFFNVNPQVYFYPASTVKLPVALLALQRFNELRVFGLNSNSTMITGSEYSRQTPAYNDPTTYDGRPTVGQYIKKIFLVSDNDAFNRLYEFLGPKYINVQLQKMGFANTEIKHRLSLPLSEDENRHTNPVRFFSEAGKFLYSQPMQVDTTVSAGRKDFVGQRHTSENKMVNEPMDFSGKNRIGLEALTDILKSVIFPFATEEKKRFNLKPEEHRFLLKYMSQYPSESSFPHYDSAEYPDDYVKFLLFGSGKDTIPRNIRIFNKVGNAYGFLTDVAYIVDFDRKVEFMLSASIYCNTDGTLNDDRYDYKTVGLPFLKNLGKLIYDYETARQKQHQPDLSEFKFTYNE